MVYLSQDEPENWFYTVEQTTLEAPIELCKPVQTFLPDALTVWYTDQSIFGLSYLVTLFHLTLICCDATKQHFKTKRGEERT